MKKYVVKFGEDYVRDYERSCGGIISVQFTSNLFNAMEVNRSLIRELKKFINLGAEIKEVTFFESNENWEIDNEIKELEEAEECETKELEE